MIILVCGLAGCNEMMEHEAKLGEQERILAHLIPRQREAEMSREYEQREKESLAARLRRGDRGAAVELVDIYYRQIYLYMRRLGHTRQESEDLTQESFLRAWHHIGQLRDGKALNGWLYRIAGNVSRHYWRRHAGKQPASIEDFDIPAGSSETEGTRAGNRELLDQVRKAIMKLPVKLKQAVVLHYMQHLTIAEAAEAAGIKEGTFKSRLSRALRALEKRIA